LVKFRIASCLLHVFYDNSKYLFKRISTWFWSQVGPGSWHEGPSSLLDNQPLRELLNRYINFEKIDRSIERGELHAYCLTACSYTSGESTTFYDGAPEIENWIRTHREGVREKMTIDHLMASSAIPVVFPSVKLGNEHFGDGSMRQTSPIRLGQIFGYVLDTLFLNSLHSDIERMERMNRTLKSNITGNDEKLKVVEHYVITPSKDIANIAMEHFSELPKSFRTALKFMGMAKSNSRRFISYLMFTKTFCQELIELGYQDAYASRDEIIDFLAK